MPVVRGDRNARHVAATASLVVRGDGIARRARRPECPSWCGDPTARRGGATPQNQRPNAGLARDAAGAARNPVRFSCTFSAVACLASHARPRCA